MVVTGIERVGRKLEPSAALDTPVTFLVVASPLGEDSSHVACEAEGPRTAAGLVTAGLQGYQPPCPRQQNPQRQGAKSDRGGTAASFRNHVF